jgi:asparagine synthetase B (glutamine-hydrolysing)
MQGILPTEIIEKHKQGFSIPIKHWLRGPLKPMMTDLLSPTTVRNRGYFDPEYCFIMGKRASERDRESQSPPVGLNDSGALAPENI